MSNGSKWDVPFLIIASYRAKYYARKDSGKTSGEEYERIYQAEMKIGMEEEEMMVDWAENNMDWSDVKEYSSKFSDAEPDFQDGWVNGEKEVIMKEVCL